MKGRPSDTVINNRLNIGISLLKEYNFRIGERQFRAEYKNAIKEEGFDVPKDSRTIASDIRKIEDIIVRDYDREIIWTSGKVEKPKPNSVFSTIGKKIHGKIRKVYLRSGDKEYLLYKGNKKLKTMAEFKKPVNELYKIRKEFGGDCLVHVFIIFNDSGYEEETADFYEREGLDKILFTGLYNCCTEIVSELRYLKTLMEDVYYTVYP